MNRAVFLDRDGVITEEPPHYAHRLDQLRLVPLAADAIRLLNESGFLVIVVSNQAGIAHGYYREEDAFIFNRGLKEKLAERGAHIDAIYLCPHHPHAEIERYRVQCECRKPEPGMLMRAAREHDIDLEQSFMVGDKLSDIDAGRRTRCRTIMVKTGLGTRELAASQVRCDYIAADLQDAVCYILSCGVRHATPNGKAEGS